MTDTDLYEYGLAPTTTARYSDSSPWASFGGGPTGREAALAHMDRDPDNRLVRRHVSGTTWEEVSDAGA